MPHQQSLTAYVAQFAVNTRFDEIPDEVILLGKKSILDALGVALSGSISEPAKIVQDYAQDFNSTRGLATVIGTAYKVQPRFAALANGIAIHVDDFDDTLQAETGRYQGVHPTAPVLSAVLSLAEVGSLSGKQLLVAYHVGIEVAARVFDATHVNHVLHGFHATATCGTIGATAGVARITNSDEMRCRTMLGIAGSMSGGLHENVGTMVKSLHAGRAAESAVVAYDLAARGMNASQTILESPRGFFRAKGGGHDEARLRGKLGHPWSFVDRGIWLKPFPTGSLGHPGMTKMLELVETHDLKPHHVKQIRVKTSENIYNTLRHHRPKTGLQAKFSLEFGLSILLFERKCGLRHFTDQYLHWSELQQMIERVEYTTFSEAEAKANGYNIVTTFLDIVLADGKTIPARINYGKGSLLDPMSMEEIAAKFCDCAEYAGWPYDKAEAVIDRVLHLEALDDVHELTALLSSA